MRRATRVATAAIAAWLLLPISGCNSKVVGILAPIAPPDDPPVVVHGGTSHFRTDYESKVGSAWSVPSASMGNLVFNNYADAGGKAPTAPTTGSWTIRACNAYDSASDNCKHGIQLKPDANGTQFDITLTDDDQTQDTDISGSKHPKRMDHMVKNGSSTGFNPTVLVISGSPTPFTCRSPSNTLYCWVAAGTQSH